MKKLIVAIIILLISIESFSGQKFKSKPILDFKVNSFLDENKFMDVWSLDLKLGYQVEFYPLKLELYVNLNSYFDWQDSFFATKNTYTFGGKIYISNFYVQFEHTISKSIDHYADITSSGYPTYHYLNQFSYRKTTLSIGFKI